MKQIHLESILKQAREAQDPGELLAAVPYGQLLGMECKWLGERLLFGLPPSDENVGNPTLPALHGGVIGGFLELTAGIHLLYFHAADRLPKVVDCSIDYLRPGRLKYTWANCEVLRQGRRMANVSVRAWQEEESAPIASAQLHFLWPDKA